MVNGLWLDRGDSHLGGGLSWDGKRGLVEKTPISGGLSWDGKRGLVEETHISGGLSWDGKRAW